MSIFLKKSPLETKPGTGRRHPVVLHGGILNGLYAMLPIPAPDNYDHRLPDGHVLRYKVDSQGRVARYAGDVTDVYNT
jgi:hypothetical protein